MDFLSGVETQKLLDWGDNITKRLDALIERAKLTPEELEAFERLKLLNEQWDKEQAERKMLAGVLADFMTQDNKPTYESIRRRMDRRGR